MTNAASPLGKLCKYAYDNTDYYRKLFDCNQVNPCEINLPDDLAKIPLLTQEVFQKEECEFLSAEYTKYPKIDDVLIKRPIGVQGRCLRIMWDKNLLQNASDNLFDFVAAHYGITAGMKTASFYTSQYRSNKILDISPSKTLRGEKNIFFSNINLTSERLLQCHADMLAFEPEVLIMPPGFACRLAVMIKDSNLPLPASLKYVELSGEYLSEECYEVVREVFKIDPVNVYSTRAAGPVAVECPEHKLHVLEDNVIVEVIKDGVSVLGEEGDIYVTVLNNPAMPLIRFETGDRGILSKDKCSCGSSSTVLQLTHARENDPVLLPNGEKIDSYVMKSIVEFTNEYMSNSIKQFQVRQIDIGAFEVKICLKPAYIHWGQAVKENFIANAEKTLLKGTNWSFDFTDGFDNKENKYFIGIK